MSIPPAPPPQPDTPSTPLPANATAPAAQTLTAEQDRMWASYAHLGGILWFVPSLIIWVEFKHRGPLAVREAKEALNWQITWIIAWAASQTLGLVIGSFFLGGFLLFSLLAPWALYIVNLVFSILGFVQVNSGGAYRYPVVARIIK